MNEESISFWKKPLRLPGLFLAWLICVAITMALFVGIALVNNEPFIRFPQISWLLFFGTLSASGLLLLWFFLRWLGCWKNSRRFVFIVGSLALLVGLFYAEEDWRGWHAWNQFQKEWSAKGEKFTVTGVAPAPVPEDQNFALTPIWVESMKAQLGPQNARQWFGGQFAENGRTNFVNRLDFNLARTDDSRNEPTNGDWARATVTDLKFWQDYYRAPVRIKKNSVALTNEFPVSPRPQSPPADVLLALSKYDSPIEELRTASQRPYSRFPVAYNCESPAAILLPHLAAEKRGSRLLQLRAIAELQNGQSEQALADVKLSLRLLAASRTEPFLISHLVRLSMWQLTLQPIWEGCVLHAWPDAKLAKLETELAKLDFVSDYALSMRCEMAFLDTEADRLRRHPQDLECILGGGDQDVALPGPLLGSLVPSGWFYQNQVRCNRLLVDYFIPAADVSQGTLSPDAARRGEATLAADTQSAGPYNVFERIAGRNWLGKEMEEFAYGQASVNLARTAIALERYRLAHGEFPEALVAIAPQFIARLPHDAIGSQVLKYRRTSDGKFVLESAGWGATDKGGISARDQGTMLEADMDQADWVWQYPAS